MTKVDVDRVCSHASCSSLPTVTFAMEQTTAARSTNAGGNYPMYGNSQLFQQTDAADSQQCMPVFQGLGSSHYQPLSDFHTSTSQFCQPFEGDGCNRHTPSQIRDMHHPYPLYQRNASGLVHPDNNHDALQVPSFQGAHSCTSPESLLDLILVAQQKLQQLQAVVELMVRVGGQAQEQQSLAAGVKSIMSQLFSATACLRQQPLDQFSGLSQSIEGFDLRFDGVYGNEVNNCVPVMRHESMNSVMKLAGMRAVETRTSSLQSDSELHMQAMEPVSMKSAEISDGPSSEVNSRLKEQGSDALFGDPSIILAHRNAGTKLVEMDISKGSLHLACNSRVTNENQELEEHDFTHVSRDDDDDGEGENLPPGSYELVEMAAAEILAEHTHFCEICGKGFKRDANLRMHMRGHGDEYKTPAALAKPDKSTASLTIFKPRRYSCPFLGCKRNKQHRKFQPLKTILCVKNHYRRSHCPKLLTCSKCKVKKFSVVADLKTHEKHCGQDKWQCSCGTTFSRKDKLTGHVNLFVGHTPVVSSHDLEILNGPSEPPPGSLTTDSVELECLGGSKATPPAPLAGGLAVNTLEGSNKNGTSTTDLTVLGDEIFIGDEICQQRAVLNDVKGFLGDNSQRGGMELMQHSG